MEVFSLLPDEVVVIIFSYLELRDLVQAQQCSKRFMSVMESRWIQLCKKENLIVPPNEGFFVLTRTPRCKKRLFIRLFAVLPFNKREICYLEYSPNKGIQRSRQENCLCWFHQSWKIHLST
jgi:hypothetical protein